MRIITRYVLREHLGPLVFSLSALTSLLLLNYVAKRLGELVGKGLPWKVIAEFLLLSVPFTFAMTMPMAVLVATLHAFSRMAAENEITALKATGVSIRRLMRPVVLAASVLTLVMVWFNDQVMPRTNHALSNLGNDIARKKPTFALREQVINEVSPQRIYLRAAHLVRGSDRMRDVTIFDLSDPQRRRTIRGDSGLLALSSDGSDLHLTLFSGSMTELTPTEPMRLQRLFFRTNFVRVRGVDNRLERDSVGGVKTDREMTICELQRRVGRSHEMRDRAWQELKGYDSVAARKWPLKEVPAGLGSFYCRLRAFAFVRAARAEAPPRPPPAGGALAQAPAQIPPQAPPREPTKPRTLVPEPTPPDTAGRAVLAEGVKLQLGEAQRIIDGDEVEIEKKFAIAAACLVFALLGAPIALRFPRAGVGMTIGVSLGVFGLYYVALIAGEALAKRSMLSPFWSMWGANFLLLAIGAWLTVRLGTEGTTTRGSETLERLHRVRERLAPFLGRRGAAP